MPLKKWKKLANEYVVSLFPVFMLVDAFAGAIQKKFGLGTPVAVKIEKCAVEYFYQPLSWDRAHKKFVSRIRKDPKHLRNIYQVMAAQGNRLVAGTRELTHLSGRESNRALWRLYQDFVKGNLEVYSYGLLLPLLDYQHSTFLTDELKSILERKRAIKHFLALTTPLSETNVRKQDLALLKLLSRFQRNPGLVKLLKSSGVTKSLSILEKRYPKYSLLLKNHVRNHNWVYYVYEGPAVSAKYFLEIMRDQLRRRVNPGRELAKFQKEKNRLSRNQQELFNQLKLNAYEKQIVLLARDSLVYKSWRRELQSHAYYHAEFLLREIGRRLRLTLPQVRMMLPHEVKAGLLAGRVNLKELNERLMIVIYGAPKSTSCLSGGRAVEFAGKYFPKEHLGKLPKILKGTAAYKGRIRGKVCIVNTPEDTKKMEAGGVLVSATTNPNLMPAIRKAAAIVTDEGGLTCHAAIVSRELKIPCVVGTNLATKVFKNGNLVEVDANRGIVRLVEIAARRVKKV